MNLNQIHLIGRVGGDPEIKSMPSGKMVASFSLATTRTWSQDGEKKEQTEWHNIVFFGDNLIEKVISPYVSKGMELYVGGRVQTRSWEKDGQKHYRTEVLGDTIQLGARPNGESGTRPSTRPAAKRPPRSAEEEEAQRGISNEDFNAYGAPPEAEAPAKAVKRSLKATAEKHDSVSDDINPEDIPF